MLAAATTVATTPGSDASVTEPTSDASVRMSATDHLLWIADRSPELRSTIVAVAVFDGAPEPDQLAARYDHVSRAVPRLRQRVRTNPVSIAPPRWELDPDFDIGRHVRWVPDADGRTFDDVLRIAAAKALEPFPTDRPLWEITAVPDLPGGEFALIQKVHHAITDGINGVRIQLELLDFAETPEPKNAPDLPDTPPLGQLERMEDAVRWDIERRRSTLGRGASLAAASRQPIASAARAAETAGSLARMAQLPTAPLSPLLTGRADRRTFATTSLSLSRAKAAGRVAGTPLNAVFLAGIAEGLLRYHRHHGHEASQVRIGMPISTRTDDSEDNAFVGTRFVLPLVYDDPVERLRTIHRLVDMHRTEPALQVLPAAAAQITRLPAPAAAQVLRRMLRGTDVQASNVPGSPLPMWLMGHRLLRQYPFGPTTTSALNITLLSYEDQLHLGIAMNAGAISDPDVLCDCLDAGFADVLDLS